MAFIDPKNFSTAADSSPSPVLMSVQDLRSHFDNDTKIGIALGGWSLFSNNFSMVATEPYRAKFSANLVRWIDEKGYDFVDIDWECPGGHGAEQPLNATADIENFLLLLDTIKKAHKPEKGVSISVAANPAGMESFKSVQKMKSTCRLCHNYGVRLCQSGGQKTGHHTDVEESKAAVQRYIDLGRPPEKINLGFPFYAKWFQVEDKIVPAQDTDEIDNHKSGVLTFEMKNIQPPPLPALLELLRMQPVVSTITLLLPRSAQRGTIALRAAGVAVELRIAYLSVRPGYGECHGPGAIVSFKRERENVKYDQGKGALWYFDETTSPRLFWSWENTDLMSRKFDEIVNNPTNKLGGVAAWSLGENSTGWMHVLQMQNMARLRSSDDQSEGEYSRLP
ncbi:hypothetical protein RRF57_003610 [Xylaria bambusicola]|uniref:chitinase n=1 Tax=Xylaria bambusicola TaxID=326684 RepID=A0AAN7U980_9PEZI